MSEPNTSRIPDALSPVPLLDRDRAERNFAQIRARVPSTVADAIPALLADVPDPDAALNLFERMTEQDTGELFRIFEKHCSLVHYALAVCGYSQYLGETLLQNPDLLPTLLREENLDRSHSGEEFREAFARFRSRSFETDIAQLLARFRRREYVRIMLRDVLGLATLSETASEISALSDVLIEEAFRECDSGMHARYGSPQHQDKQGRWIPTPFAILALGKLGGNELNYSSDVDLMFVYGDGESRPDAPITNREYFIRLAQQITDVLSRITREGFVFRIDLRLRPQGREGESAVSLGQSLRYYRDEADDWERQAMIKVRHCAGDVALARQFIRKVQESVYTERVNFAAIETALRTRDRFQDRRKKAMARGEGIDVKLDPGGIRDIEFLVQCLQRVYGGKESWLRSGGTLFSLQKLHDKQHIAGADFHQLTSAYEFLRTVEHRLQLRRGQQTHCLPEHPEDIAILERSLHNESASAENLVGAIRSRMEAVAAIYQRIIHRQQQQTEEQVNQEFELRTLDLSFGRVQSDRQILQRLAADNTALYGIASRADLEPHTRRNLFRFLSSAFTSAERYAAVAEAPALVEKALAVFRESEFLTDILVRHPEAVAAIGDLRQSSPRHPSGGLFAAGDAVPFNQQDLASSPLAYGNKLTLLRRRFRHRVFLSGVRDVIEARPVFTSLADTTFAAEEAISAALAMSSVSGLAVMALGRLGTHEFDCLSDADLLFVRDSGLPSEEALQAVESMMHALSAYTQEGTVLTVDAQLRPHGADGPLTTTPGELASYLMESGQAWEALAYTKLRLITGEERIASEVLAGNSCAYRRLAESSRFVEGLLEMRARLENSDDAQNMKTGSGGLYDIDFVIGCLLIQHGITTAEGNARQRLQKLGRAGLLNAEDLQVLLDGLDLMRTLEHVSRLATGRAQRSLPVSENARRAVEELVARIHSPEMRQDLDAKLMKTRQRVRGVFDRILRSS